MYEVGDEVVLFIHNSRVSYDLPTKVWQHWI